MGVSRGRGTLFTFSSWLDASGVNVAMSLEATLEHFRKYKEHLDELDRDGTESSASVDTYEKQFMVR